MHLSPMKRAVPLAQFVAGKWTPPPVGNEEATDTMMAAFCAWRYKGRGKTVCKGTGNGGIKGRGNPSPANVLIGNLMNASEPHGRTVRLNTY